MIVTVIVALALLPLLSIAVSLKVYTPAVVIPDTEAVGAVTDPPDVIEGLDAPEGKPVQVYTAVDPVAPP